MFEWLTVKAQEFTPLLVLLPLVFFLFFYQLIKYQLLNMLKIKHDINQQDFKIVHLHHFPHLELWIASAGHKFKWVKISIK